MTVLPDPDEAVSLYLQGVKLRQQDRWHEAFERQQRAVSLKPDLAEAHYEIGVIKLHERQGQEALAAFVRALEADPLLPEGHYGRGCAYRQLKRYDDACDAFREAIRLRPDYALAWEELGIVYGLLKRFDAAEAALREALRAEPHNARVHCALGHLLVMSGAVDRAREELDVLEQLDEELADLLRALIATAVPAGAGWEVATYGGVSARNQLQAVVVDVKKEGVLALVHLSVGGQTLEAIITSESADELGLKVGDAVTALVKATDVLIARPVGR